MRWFVPVGELSENVKRLLVALGTIEMVEVLLLFARNPDRSFSASQVAKELFIPRSVGRMLERLASLNLVDVRLGSSVLYRYAPTTPELGAVVLELAREYNSRPLFVLDSIRSTSAIEAFADAFRFKKKRREDDG
jgi:hypothetical protein